MSDLLGAPPLTPFRSYVAQSSSIEDRRWRGNGDDDGHKERETNRRQVMAKRHHGEWARSKNCGALGSQRRMWPGNPLLVACSWSVPDQRPCLVYEPFTLRYLNLFLFDFGSAALLYLPVASTPCMGGLLWAPSGEVGRRGNFCLLCAFLSFWRGGGGSTLHCHHNDLEVSCTYGNTQTSTSRMLWEYLVYDTP